MSEDKTTERNAGKQQEPTKKPAGKSKQTFTKRNEDFMFRLKRELKTSKLSDEKKNEALLETESRLLEGQLKGETAKQIYGTPTDRVKGIIAGPKKAPVETKYWMKVLDNSMVFLMIFSLMFGIMMIAQPKSIAEQPGPAGITAMVAISLIGGACAPFLTDRLQPTSKTKERSSIWKTIAMATGMILVWMVAYMAFSSLPAAVNPVLPYEVYLAMAVALFFVRMWFKRRYHLTGGFLG
ncbi:Integral membrane protein [Pediococcus damnosus]|uniref:Integral membrane protein n=1 Tax=Pediococcus damnosus TaxID=51663 RepID=A0A0R2HW66_9LACO|nr:DUF1129 family protein [Pediococcus damnosus]AMV60423.1 Integral membrane protein [Pediococcus damnosus]AMV63174.1 Integral membrane protein [Pediococcus damnosus]AMV64675.1 Integral membrane protein [Pediococcus damnosus]AMV66932.1 Integral membrane protein [Pediococcus damnosus]AMV69466.1 Integral membrane protein [Pediococcus damnosus]